MTTTIITADCLDWMRGQPDRSVDLVFTSPPYEDARTYGIGFRLKGQDWVEWLIPRVIEMCRLSSGLVFVNAAGKVSKGMYHPVMEWLVADLTRKHGIVCGPSPYVFHRIGIPGSGGPRYQARRWEPVYAFCFKDRLPVKWSDNTATGKPPKYKPGGKPSHHGKNGRITKRDYKPPKLANPGNVISCKVGGGHMGNDSAHDSPAPFPEELVKPFVLWFCPPGGTVLDPFGGSGTTAAVAKRLGRNGISIDIREEQSEVARQRCGTVQQELFA